MRLLKEGVLCLIRTVTIEKEDNKDDVDAFADDDDIFGDGGDSSGDAVVLIAILAIFSFICFFYCLGVSFRIL